MRRYFTMALALIALALWFGPAQAQFGKGLTGPEKQKLDAARLNLPSIPGTWYYANMKTGNEKASGLYIDEAVCSVQTAVNKCVKGRGDGVVLLSDSTTYSFTVSRACTLSKMGMKVVGVSNGNPFFNRARVATAGGTKANASGIHYVFVVTAQNVELINLFAANEDSGGYGCLKLSAARFKATNCHFLGGVMADAGAGDSAASCNLEINTVSEYTFVDCEFGSNSTDRNPTAIQGNIYLTGAQGQGKFINCWFRDQTDDQQHCGVKLGDAATINGCIDFIGCHWRAWIASSTPALASLVNGTPQNNPGLLFDKNCDWYGYAALDTLDAQAFQAGKASDSLGVYSPR